MKRERPTCLAVILIFGSLLGGCPGLPGFNTVVVEVFNDTRFEIAPRIRFDDDSNWLASAFPSEELSPSILEPGELISYNMDCDEVGVIFSDSAGQFFLTTTIGQADTTRHLTRDDDYDCGARIQFHFVGEGDGFGVIVSVNGRVID